MFYEVVLLSCLGLLSRLETRTKESNICASKFPSFKKGVSSELSEWQRHDKHRNWAKVVFAVPLLLAVVSGIRSWAIMFLVLVGGTEDQLFFSKVDMFVINVSVSHL